MLLSTRLRGLVSGAATVVALGLATLPAHADATLDRIHKRGSLVIGIILSGPPFGYIDPATQAQKGFNLDLAKALAEGLGVKLETVTVTPPNRVQFLQQGKVDALIANMQYTDERAKILDYVPTPYDRSGGAGLGRVDGPIKDWKDVKGRAVCISQGSNYAKPLQEELGADVKGLPSQPDSVLALKGGNCDLAVHVGATLRLMLEDHPDEWKGYGIVIPTELIPSDSVIWIRKGDKDTSAALDAVMRDLHGTGKILTFAKANRLYDSGFLTEAKTKYAK
jgi:polar amino acid transport system substrate-binding protein